MTEYRIILIVFTVVFIVPLFIFLLPKDERAMACGSVEWEFQNAFQCMAYPHMWERWSEIHGIYNYDEPETYKGVVGCPKSIQKLEKYNLNSDEKVMFTYLTKVDGDTGLTLKFKELEGVEFCNAAEIHGWVKDFIAAKEN